LNHLRERADDQGIGVQLDDQDRVGLTLNEAKRRQHPHAQPPAQAGAPPPTGIGELRDATPARRRRDTQQVLQAPRFTDGVVHQDDVPHQRLMAPQRVEEIGDPFLFAATRADRYQNRAGRQPVSRRQSA
jgi:hypothetical protein